jgi:hypothetical protein
VPADMVADQEDADGFLVPMRLGFVYRREKIDAEPWGAQPGQPGIPQRPVQRGAQFRHRLIALGLGGMTGPGVK